jgi:hypothetical protein
VRVGYPPHIGAGAGPAGRIPGAGIPALFGHPLKMRSCLEEVLPPFPLGTSLTPIPAPHDKFS